MNQCVSSWSIDFYNEIKKLRDPEKEEATGLCMYWTVREDNR